MSYFFFLRLQNVPQLAGILYHFLTGEEYKIECASNISTSTTLAVNEQTAQDRTRVSSS
jgi:hypothetical protein